MNKKWVLRAWCCTSSELQRFSKSQLNVCVSQFTLTFYPHKRSKIVTARHVSVPQNILKMHLRPELRPGPHWVSLQ